MRYNSDTAKTLNRAESHLRNITDGMLNEFDHIIEPEDEDRYTWFVSQMQQLHQLHLEIYTLRNLLYGAQVK